MSDGPVIVHQWDRIQFIALGEKPWTNEEVVDFILEIEERVMRGAKFQMRPALPRLVKKDG